MVLIRKSDKVKAEAAPTDDSPTATAPKRKRRAPRCQHPNVIRGGICKGDSVGVFDIPDDYEIVNRYANPNLEPVPRPTARLCRQHRYMVANYKTPPDQRKGHHARTHEAQCDICQHPQGDHVLRMWVNWRISSSAAMSALNITPTTFYSHIDHFNLQEKKAEKDHRKRLLIEAIEKGMATGDHSVNTALKASEQLNKLQGDTIEEVKHTHTGGILVGNIDLTQVGDGELADMLEKLAAQVREGAAVNAAVEAGRQVKQLPSDVNSGNVIELPKSNVKVMK
jgi:hypothetical protein